MTQPTSTIQPYNGGTITDVSSRAKLEIDEKKSTLLPNEYVYLLANIPLGKVLKEPFSSSDSGVMQLLGEEEQERSQSGLVFNNQTRSISLEYLPVGTPDIVFFGNIIPIDMSKLRGGVVEPAIEYDGIEVYKFNVFYNVNFHVIRHIPNHPELISGGIEWEKYRGDGDLKSWPVEYQVEWI